MQGSSIVATVYLTGSRRIGARTMHVGAAVRCREAAGGGKSAFFDGMRKSSRRFRHDRGKGWPHSRLRE
jgi:hypothetical protein